MTEAFAKGLFKLMAYKDEYEVARLYADGEFARALKEQFDGESGLKVLLAPPLLARRDEEPPSTYSATPPSGGWSAPFRPSIRR